MTKTKVFGIGFQKTGTTTLGVIFDKLDYKIAGYHEFRHLAHRTDLTMEELKARVLELAGEVDAVKDTPWPIFYKELDAAFPGSKFIHVTRDRNAWIKSAVNDFAEHPNAIHRLIYGSDFPKGNEIAWQERYDAHNAEVEAYFAGRPEDYLSLRLEDGVSFEKICPFLGEPLVATGTPQANTRLKKKLKMAWWRLSGKG